MRRGGARNKETMKPGGQKTKRSKGQRGQKELVAKMAEIIKGRAVGGKRKYIPVPGREEFRAGTGASHEDPVTAGTESCWGNLAANISCDVLGTSVSMGPGFET